MATERIDIVVRARGTNQVNRKIKSIGTSANSTRKLLALMRSALVIVASVRVLAGFTRLIDVFTEMKNRLRLVTDNTKALVTVQSELFKIAQETRTSFESIGTVFTRTTRSTLRMKLSFRELLAITRGLAQTISISGAATQEASSALIQFSQGLSAGALQGEELRSVAEQLPKLANIIGKEFGIAGGELIAFNKANLGVFKTERVIKALKDALPGLDTEFGKTTSTISQGFTRVSNALVFFLGGINDATGVSKVLADGLNTVANNIDKVILALLAVGGVVAFNFLAGQVLGLITLFANLVTVVGSGLVRAFLLLISPLKAVVRLFLSLRIAILTNPLFLIGAAAVGLLVGSFFLFKEELKQVAAEMGGVAGIFNSLVSFVGAGVSVMINNFDLLAQTLKETVVDAINDEINAFETLFNIIPRGIAKLKDLREKLFGFAGPSEATVPDLFDFGRVEIETSDSLSKLVQVFKDKFKEIEESNPAATIQERFQSLLDFFNKFTLSGAEGLDGLLDLFPTGAGGVSSSFADIGAELKALSAIVSGLSPLLKIRADLLKVETALTKARAKGISVLKEFGITEDEIRRRTIRNALGVKTATESLTDSVEVLRFAMSKGAITLEEFNMLLRDARIEALELDKSFDGQLTKSLLEFGKELENTGELAGENLVNAFTSAEDALVSFVTTGKADFNSLINSIIADIARLQIRQAITGPLFGSLTGGGGGSFFGDLLGSVGSAFGFNTGSAIGATAGPSLDGGLGAGGIPGLRTGGQFTVGGAGGADSKLIAFKATPGEQVNVTRPDQLAGASEGDTRPIQVTFNIRTPDAASFNNRATQNQIARNAERALSRAAVRNN